MNTESRSRRRSASPIVLIILGLAFAALGAAGNRLFLVAALFFIVGGVLGMIRARGVNKSGNDA
jgi:hypothetical protein